MFYIEFYVSERVLPINVERILDGIKFFSSIRYYLHSNKKKTSSTFNLRLTKMNPPQTPTSHRDSSPFAYNWSAEPTLVLKLDKERKLLRESLKRSLNNHHSETESCYAPRSLFDKENLLLTTPSSWTFSSPTTWPRRKHRRRHHHRYRYQRQPQRSSQPTGSAIFLTDEPTVGTNLMAFFDEVDN